MRRYFWIIKWNNFFFHLTDGQAQMQRNEEKKKLSKKFKFFMITAVLILCARWNFFSFPTKKKPVSQTRGNTWKDKKKNIFEAKHKHFNRLSTSNGRLYSLHSAAFVDSDDVDHRFVNSHFLSVFFSRCAYRNANISDSSRQHEKNIDRIKNIMQCDCNTSNLEIIIKIPLE